MHDRGEEVSFELSNADASTAKPIVVYTIGSGATGRQVRTIGAKERLVVTDVHIVSAVALAGDFYDGNGAAPASGERIVPIVTTTSNGVIVTNLSVPHYCQTGVTPQVKTAAAGQFTLSGTGFIIKA
jgi:hypothetical protein